MYTLSNYTKQIVKKHPVPKAFHSTLTALLLYQTYNGSPYCYMRRDALLLVRNYFYNTYVEVYPNIYTNYIYIHNITCV